MTTIRDYIESAIKCCQDLRHIDAVCDLREALNLIDAEPPHWRLRIEQDFDKKRRAAIEDENAIDATAWGRRRRDMFAAAALEGILSSGAICHANGSRYLSEPKLLAFDARIVADALVEELDRTKGGGK